MTPPDDAPQTGQLPERIASKITVFDNFGCWEWCSPDRKGYGYIAWEGRNRPAHRIVFELLAHAVPSHLVMDHVCRNPRCVNPGHLEPVTDRENVLRGVGLSAQRARQTHCKRGHEFTDDNTYYKTTGQRQCRTCRRLHNVDYKRLRRAARLGLTPPEPKEGGA